ncbi:hypothetical protein E1A91_A11G319800v1 [Gossypium mustelinum]|uniref:Uncharacterized protein n=1 Tax=Gossypium mustelinum TaxID=34275 RepID=A0A5D2XDC4_GOSMU|nr:hypothetical protein E1A91_A11G319800v1 [Gossypium mustelinum]
MRKPKPPVSSFIFPKKKRTTKHSLSPFVSLTIGFSLPATPPRCSVAGDVQKWVFQPHFEALLKVKPSASYKNEGREPSAPLQNRL